MSIDVVATKPTKASPTETLQLGEKIYHIRVCSIVISQKTLDHQPPQQEQMDNGIATLARVCGICWQIQPCCVSLSALTQSFMKPLVGQHNYWTSHSNDCDGVTLLSGKFITNWAELWLL